MRLKTLFLLVIFFTAAAYLSQSSPDYRNHRFKSFSAAKKEVYKASLEMKTFYCGCRFNSQRQVDLDHCGYKVRKSKKRARQVEIEHVVPADKLCGNLKEWKTGSPQCVNAKGIYYKGRRCATEVNEICKMAYNDLHNLRPAIGEINNDRSNYPFADLPDIQSPYGACRFKIDRQKVDPPTNVRGDIARIYLHMNAAYPELNIINLDEIDFFMQWSAKDPVSREECEYDNRIFRSQGVHNRFIYRNCPAK